MNHHASANICIIGAGPCGLATAKNLQQQGITQFTVFEKNNQIGGNWILDETNDHASIYETTHIISSKRLSQFEDYPMPADYPDYPSHTQVLAYFQNYAKHFALAPYIQLNTCVEKITPINQHQWKVSYRNAAGQQDAVFDYVLVANGHHWDPIMPTYPGTFLGTQYHAHQYKKAEPFRNQRVLVVGGGNSACDIAVEISRISSNTSISMRNGQHIFPKFIFGKPTDIAFSYIHWMPSKAKQWLASRVIRILQGRYDKYQLPTPDHKPLATHPTINSELLYFIRHGKIKPRSGIERFENHTVYFTNGTHETFDTIIYATGYQISFPFFDKNLIDFSQMAQIPLYRKMMHPDYDTLYFIGLFQPQGCIWPLADHQANIAARIIAGNLPRPKHLTQKIEKEIKANQSQFKSSLRHAIEVDYRTFRKQLLKELA